jgi:undecaprenyl-diphosphatase
MSPLDAFFLGLIQGLTEFLPVSSSGHLVVLSRVLGEGGLTFDVWLHLATLVAVAAALRREIVTILRSLSPGAGGESTAWGRRMVVGVIVGTIPAVIVGLLLKDAVETAFTSIRVVGIDLIVTAVILWISRSFVGGSKRLTPMRAWWVGVGQALAILPGISRAGTTLATGLAMGLPGVEAARFSFILSMPAILGAVVLDLPALAGLGSTAPAALAVGFVTAALSGYAAVRIVWRVMERGRLALFAPYCALLGIVVLVWSFLA